MKLMVADDSVLMRGMLRAWFSSAGDFEVHLVKNGREAVDLAPALRPDVAILDVNMPVMDGVSALRELVKLGIPCIMFSSLTTADSRVTMEALDIGAFDFVPKPGGTGSSEMAETKTEILKKVVLAARSKRTPLGFHPKAASAPLPAREIPAEAAFLIAASTGGPSVIKSMIQSLSPPLGVAVLIVQHLPPFFTKAFAEHLASHSRLPVKEATNGECIYEDQVYLAPGEWHMEVSGSARPVIALHQGPKINYVRPSADPLFASAARHFGSRTLAAVLTGMGNDGTRGAIAVKAAGGYVVAQDEATSAVYGMPKGVKDAGAADEVLSVEGLITRLPVLLQRLR